MGLDPGLSGAMAIYDAKAKDLLYLEPLPLFRRNSKREIDLQAFCGALSLYAPSVGLIALESVHSMPGQGIASTFRFGDAYGQIKGIFAALLSGVPILPAVPSVWKTQMHLSSEKIDSRYVAAELFPDHADRFAAKSSDGVAEAALLAVWGAVFGLKSSVHKTPPKTPPHRNSKTPLK